MWQVFSMVFETLKSNSREGSLQSKHGIVTYNKQPPKSSNFS